MKIDSDYIPLVAAFAFLIIMYISLAVSSAYETRVLQEKGLEAEAQKLTNILKEMK